MMRQILSRPKSKAGAMIDRVDNHHRVRVFKRYAGWCAELLCLFEHGIIKQTFGIRRVEFMFSAPAMEADVKCLPGKPS
jgi:hypothetical protein